MEKYVTGMFVKISSGIDELGNNKYFLAQIDGLINLIIFSQNQKNFVFHDLF